MRELESADMQISRALRLISPSSNMVNDGIGGLKIAFVGAGGKTTAIFQLARELLSLPRTTHDQIIVTATSHLGTWQIPLADQHFIIESPSDFSELQKGLILITGAINGERTLPVSPFVLSWLREYTEGANIPLLIEADGARGKPIKAPADHEPPIPEFVNMVVVLAGLNALGQPLTDDFVFRSERIRQLLSIYSRNNINTDGSGKPAFHDVLTTDDLVEILSHPKGGLKNIPAGARRVLILNQADTPELQAVGGNLARRLSSHFDSILVGSLQKKEFLTFEQTAGIVLAAGESIRFGTPKQLMDWKGQPFIRHVAGTALDAGLQPVIVVLGSNTEEVSAALAGLPVTIINNENWQSGQASSIVKGVFSLPPKAGSAIFLLVDQPQIGVDVVRALVDAHSQNLSSIIAPLVMEEKRANPVLFDRVTFPDLLALTGDIGGRAIFNKHHLEYLPWHDEKLLLDVDTPEDYKRLCAL